MNKALHHPDTIKVRLRNQIKKTTPNATQIPDRPQLGSTTDQLERNNIKDKIFIELLLDTSRKRILFGHAKVALVQNRPLSPVCKGLQCRFCNRHYGVETKAPPLVPVRHEPALKCHHVARARPGCWQTISTGWQHQPVINVWGGFGFNFYFSINFVFSI